MRGENWQQARMPWRDKSLTTLLIATPALLVLAGLMAAGLLPAGTGWLVMAVACGLAFAVATLWHRAITALALRLTQPGAAAPDWPGLEQVSEAARRQASLLAERTAELERRREDEPRLLDHMPAPVFVLGANRAALRANAAARALLGAEPAALLRHPDLRAAIERAEASGAASEVDISLKIPLEREMRASAVPLDPPLADGGRMLVLLADHSAAHALARARADFVANASHELRTPLASLLGFIETIRGPAADDPPAQAKFLAIMAEQGARMSRLIDDLLLLSRAEMNEHDVPTDSVALSSLSERLAAALAPRLVPTNATLVRDVPASLPAVRGDADQLVQMLQNLLDNALKYGRPSGTIRLTAQSAPQGSAGGTSWPDRPGLVVAVADDGIGIPRAHLPRLTERFYRVDAGRSRAIGGTGLGLAIVKHIVNRHRGELRIESEEGKGTTVSVWLPLA
jgi:two-component system phosphate regulon sensor histidine kinase PhoR